MNAQCKGLLNPVQISNKLSIMKLSCFSRTVLFLSTCNKTFIKTESLIPSACLALRKLSTVLRMPDSNTLKGSPGQFSPRVQKITVAS